MFTYILLYAVLHSYLHMNYKCGQLEIIFSIFDQLKSLDILPIRSNGGYWPSQLII